MARITIEDCLDNVDNRFELVLAATKRARDLSFGRVESSVAIDNDKFTVVALREIAAGNYNYDKYLQEISDKETTGKEDKTSIKQTSNQPEEPVVNTKSDSES